MIDLTPYLEQTGLRISHVRGAEIQAWCPAHAERTGKADTKPSFYFNQVKLVGHCYSCDWRVGTLEMLVSHLTGGPVDDSVILEARSYSLGEAVQHIGRRKAATIDANRVLNWKWKQLRPVPAQLLSFRRLSAAMAAWFEVRYDPERRCWAIPVHSPHGRLLGWQERQKGAVYNYPEGMVKSGALFAIHRYDTDRLALVESPLDAVRLYQAGIPAVASYGAEVSDAQIELLARHCSEVYVAMDNPRIDAAGKRATDKVLRLLRKRTGAVPWHYEGRIKDIGECRTDDEIREMFHKTRQYGL